MISINWTDYIFLRNIEGKPHQIFKHKNTGEQKFVKFLRLNNYESTKELVSEFLANKIFFAMNIEGLNPFVAIKEGKPVIVMDYWMDTRKLAPFGEVRIENREYFAAALYLIDVLVKNTNRATRRDHMGWKETDSGEIRLCPLDNGHTLGHGSGDDALLNDDDLISIQLIKDQYQQHFSSILSPLQAVAVEQTIQRLDTLNFQVMGEEIISEIITSLAPTDEEVIIIRNRINSVIEMLLRRKPKACEIFRQIISSAPLVESQANVEIAVAK